MFRLALRSLLANRIRLALTTVSVVLGVSFVAGSFVLGDTIDAAFDDVVGNATSRADVYVTAATDFDGGALGSARAPLPEQVVDAVADIDGVATATGYVEGTAQVVTDDGGVAGGIGMPQLGVTHAGPGSPLTIREGRPPIDGHQVAIDAGTADAEGLAVGDPVDVVVPVGRRSYTVSGIVGFGDADSLLGSTLTVFSLDEAQRVFDRVGQVDRVVVAGHEDVDAADLRDRIAATLGSDVEVVTAAQEAASQTEDLGTFTSIVTGVLLGFALVSLFVGGFIIANTFSITVAQRTRDYALLRAVGAEPRQVRTAVLTEAGLIGVVASALGLASGIGLAAGLRALMNTAGVAVPATSLVVAQRTVVVSVLVGLGATILSALLPARRAARTPAIEAMRGTAGTDAAARWRGPVGLAIIALGVAVTVTVLAVDGQALLVAVGAMGALAGTLVAAPTMAEPLGHLLGRVPSRLGVPGRLATGNVRRDPRRTAATASALTVGLALVVFASIFAASARDSVAGTLEEQLTGDMMVRPSNALTVTMPVGVARELAERDELAVVSPLRFGVAGRDGTAVQLNGIDPATIGSVADLKLVAGDLADLHDQGILLAETVMAGLDVEIGDTVELTFTATGPQSFEVVGAYENTGFLSGFTLTLDAYDRNFTEALDTVVMVGFADGTPPNAARAAVQDVVARFPGTVAETGEELAESMAAQIDQALGLVFVLLLLAVVIALIGITNTLALAVHERTRELGLLRAVGTTRRQVRSMVRWEASMVAAIGALLGTLLGAFFGWALVASLADDGFSLVLPWGQLLSAILVAALAGVAAALLPARRAARLDVLQAVTTE